MAFKSNTYIVRLATTAALTDLSNPDTNLTLIPPIPLSTLQSTGFTVLNIDGITPNTNDLILVKNQTDPRFNGIYRVINKGSGSVKYVIKRDIPSLQLKTGDSVFVREGTINAGLMFILTTNVFIPGPSAAATAGISNYVFTVVTGSGAGAVSFDSIAPKSAIDPKGDLIVRQIGGYQALPLGVNNAVLKVDTSTAFGVKWDAAGVIDLNSISPTNNKGDLMVDNGALPGASVVSFSVGTNGQVLSANSATGTGLQWINNELDDVLDKSAAFTTLATKGSLLVDSGVSAPNWSMLKLAAGVNGQILSVNSATGTGLEWINSTVVPGGINTQVQFNDSGGFGGDTGFTYNKVLNKLSLDLTGAYQIAGVDVLMTPAVGGSVVIGPTAGSVITGIHNVIAGVNTFISGTSGTDNTVMGFGALNNVVSGSNNSAFGSLALNSASSTANNLTAFGFSALKNTTGGTSLTAVGYEALLTNTVGSNSTAVGFQCLKLATGADNTGLGSGCLDSVVAGINNTGVGAFAGTAIFDGTNNSCFGRSAGTAISSGSNNVVIGSGAGSTLSTGSGNIIMRSTAATLTTGTDNIIIGPNTANVDVAARSRCIVLGTSAVPTADGQFALGVDAARITAITPAGPQAGVAIPATATKFLQITVNGTVYYIPMFV